MDCAKCSQRLLSSCASYCFTLSVSGKEVESWHIAGVSVVVGMVVVVVSVVVVVVVALFPVMLAELAGECEINKPYAEVKNVV
jgi:hypothetical protein